MGHCGLLLQFHKCQVDLVRKLDSLGKNNPQALKQMFALYDGTRESIQITPDVQLFKSNKAGATKLLDEN